MRHILGRTAVMAVVGCALLARVGSAGDYSYFDSFEAGESGNPDFAYDTAAVDLGSSEGPPDTAIGDFAGSEGSPDTVASDIGGSEAVSEASLGGFGSSEAAPDAVAMGMGSSDGAPDAAVSTRDRRDRKRRSCKQRLNQLVMYDDRTVLAKKQGKPHFEEATWQRLSFLEDQFKDRCPALYTRRMSDRRAVRAARWTKEAVKTAVDVTKAYFTGGLY